MPLLAYMSSLNTILMHNMFRSKLFQTGQWPFYQGGRRRSTISCPTGGANTTNGYTHCKDTNVEEERQRDAPTSSFHNLILLWFCFRLSVIVSSTETRC